MGSERGVSSGDGKADAVKTNKPSAVAPQYEVDTSRAESGVWLLKVPSYVAKAWTRPMEGGAGAAAGVPSVSAARPQGGAKAPLGGIVVGKMRMTIDPLDEQPVSSAQFSLVLDRREVFPERVERVSQILEFPLLADAQQTPMHVFVMPPKGGMQISVEGVVERKFDMKLSQDGGAIDPGLLDAFRKKQKAANTPKRRTQFLDSDTTLPPTSTRAGLYAMRQAASKGAARPDKRVRSNKDDLHNQLFSLFKRQPLWSLKDLMSVTNEPQQSLKEGLEELCNLHTSGAHHSKYELKPEYNENPESLPK